MRTPVPARAALATLALALLVACGGGDDSASDQPETSTTVTTTVETTTSLATTSTTAAAPSTSATLAANPTNSPLTAASRIHIRGVGPVHAGMTVRQAEQLAGVPLQVESLEPFDGLCYYAVPVGLDGLSFMVGAPNRVRPDDPLDGVILRAEARNPAWSTISGLRVGSTSAEVVEAYGQRIETEPHIYQPGGEYLTLTGTDTDAGFGIRFETTAEGIVEDIFAGDAGAITAVEGCA